MHEFGSVRVLPISGFVRFRFFPATEKRKFGSGSVLCAESSVLFCSVRFYASSQMNIYRKLHRFMYLNFNTCSFNSSLQVCFMLATKHH